ncbi:hypothetical protein SCHPADRAFT_924086 [Schizopora paradoxa]|uniref:Uncharacterized protein n=1 Tax=Schizopora paradoxa TaxID=27342 RepID=A0A0H2SDB3_9AGAM|nr:hypothetical protein SCHPADRAFT_924086 [Schizopora paradoxa]
MSNRSDLRTVFGTKDSQVQPKDFTELTQLLKRAGEFGDNEQLWLGPDICSDGARECRRQLIDGFIDALFRFNDQEVVASEYYYVYKGKVYQIVLRKRRRPTAEIILVAIIGEADILTSMALYSFLNDQTRNPTGVIGVVVDNGNAGFELCNLDMLHSEKIETRSKSGLSMVSFLQCILHVKEDRKVEKEVEKIVGEIKAILLRDSESPESLSRVFAQGFGKLKRCLPFV